jgi:hypothetical protein
MSEDTSHTALTRRRLVQAGVAGAATAGLGSFALESVSRAAVDGNPELLRSTYLSLTSPMFTVETSDGTRRLELVAVEDLPVASAVPALRDSDNAFAITFAGLESLQVSDATTMSHPEIGEFLLFVSPVERKSGDGRQHYTAIVDSVVRRAPLHADGSPAAVDPGPRAQPPAPASVTKSQSPDPPRLLRAVLRRSASKRAIMAELTFSATPRVTVARAILRRHGRVVARTAGRAHGGRMRLGFAARHARAGRYELTIIAVDAAGRVTRIVVALKLA